MKFTVQAWKGALKALNEYPHVVLTQDKTVVVVSYSAFDTFVIPGTNETERKRLEDSGDLFGYVYCGLRE